MKKKFLSLALVLALCLSLAVPAFAADTKWKLAVPGKSDAQVSVGARSFTVRDWAVTGTYEEEEYSGTGSIWTKSDSRTYTAENVYAMSKGDSAVITRGGEIFTGFYITAWSDPDGDGVYDQRITDLASASADWNEIYLPANSAGPVRSIAARTSAYFYMPGPWYFQQPGATPSEYGFWDPDGFGGIGEVTELKMKPDFLLELYGPNTIVNLTTIEGDWSCTILVEVNDSQPTTPSATDFSDVKSGDWFAEPVAWAVEKKITDGTGKGQFSPSKTCTQAQILTFLWRAKGEPKPAGTVGGTAYYDAAAQWAHEQGLLEEFTADDPCTRAMVVTYLWKLAGSPAAKAADFSDVAADADYAGAVSWAVETGVTDGTGNNTFSPDKTCTRGEIVTFLFRALGK